jgi:alpha-beta hydrolase superfamily lysophospholipase
MITEKLKIASDDGKTIDAIEYRPENDIKVVMVVHHGFGENAGRYKNFSEYFTKSGVACLAMDARGHGKMDVDDRKRTKLYGIAPSYNVLLQDVDTVTQYVVKRHPNIPLVLYGHSMGGNIAVNYLLKYDKNPYIAAILETPWLRLAIPMSPIITLIARVFGKLSPSVAVVNKIDVNALTRDAVTAKEIESDPYYHNRLSMRLFVGLTDGGEYAINNASHLKTPILLLAAGNDTIVSSEAISELNENAGNVTKLLSYKDALHSIHNDIIKGECLNDMLNFVNERSIAKE